MIELKGVDVLLVAGDVFDTSTPSNSAQQLYYRFLCRVAASSCRHVVVIAGNHDSPTFLNAPKELLQVLNVHVVGSVSEDLGDEVLVLQDEHGTAELIVCAVPYLRDRDIRLVAAGESVEDKERKLITGIREHYAEVAALAERRRQELGVDVPIVGMGHLFAAGGQTVEGDGVRELYVGSLAHVSAGIFPDNLAYLALGHLHVPQQVGGSERIRYSGSPIPMGFGEAKQQKSVCLVELQGNDLSLEVVDLPVFQPLERIQGDWAAIETAIARLADEDSRAWLELIYESDTLIGDLRERLDEALEGTAMEILRVKNKRISQRLLASAQDIETLDDLDEHQVFERCLAAHAVPPEQQAELLSAYQETLASLHQEDTRAE